MISSVFLVSLLLGRRVHQFHVPLIYRVGAFAELTFINVELHERDEGHPLVDGLMAHHLCLLDHGGRVITSGVGGECDIVTSGVGGEREASGVLVCADEGRTKGERDELWAK